MTRKKVYKLVSDRLDLVSDKKTIAWSSMSLLGILIFSAVNIDSNSVYAQENLNSQSPPSLDVEAASIREKERIVAQEKQRAKAPENATGISTGAEPIKDISISLVPILNVDPEVKQQLNRQFEEIQTLLETENAFSEKLGENYFSYGKLLIQVARVEEARDAFIKAMHIAKVNNGVESIEQRPMLRQLFEISYALRNVEDSESIAKRIEFLEKKRPENRDSYSFDIIMRLGHLHMNMYLENPLSGAEGLQSINDAMRYFSYAYNRYGDRPLSEILMPYGELAYLWYLKHTIKLEVASDLRRGIRDAPYASLDNSRVAITPQRARSEGLILLNDYYEKANAEGDIENEVRALLNTADLNLLYGAQNEALQYYAKAWERGQLLSPEHPLILSFNNPVKLPNFKYGLIDPIKIITKEFDEIPLSLTIDINGRVRRAEDNDLDREQYGNVLRRAKRRAKKFRFRPIIENGKLLKASTIQYLVKLPISKFRSKKKRG